MDKRRRLENDDETPVVGMESFTFAYKRAESGLICPHGYSHHWGSKIAGKCISNCGRGYKPMKLSLGFVCVNSV